MIFRPFMYLRIRHESKYWYDFIWPLTIGLSFAILTKALQIDLPFVGADGLLRQVNSLIGVLAGFYIASLAAISTLSSPNIDDKMAGDPPTLVLEERGKKYKKDLTRREYLRYLFGYLALLSILLFFAGIVLDIFYSPLVSSFGDNATVISVASGILAAVYVVVLSNLMLNSLIGVYYLADRIHRTSGKSEKRDNPPDQNRTP